MSFNMKSWNNPITLDANNLNRIEQGIKNVHDTLEITNEEVYNLQNKQAKIVAELNTLTKDTPNILNTLNKVTQLLNNNDISAALSSADTFLMKTPQTLTSKELSQVYKNLGLNNFLKLTSIKVNDEDVVSGSEVNIKLPSVDSTLNINSSNAISNSAVAKALQNVQVKVDVPTKLSELKQDAEHQTVSALEKSKWNSIGDNLVVEETDPTVPAWAKEPIKPFYDYSEILNTPEPITDNAQLLNGSGFINSEESETLANNLLSTFNSQTITPMLNRISSLESTDTTIINMFKDKADLSHEHTKEDITDFSHSHTKEDITNFDHTHTKSNITDFSHTHSKEDITNLPTSKLTMQLNGSSIGTFTPSANTDITTNIQALPNFSLNISHGTAGNPRQVKFLSINYASKATYFKMSATSCHDNGTSYQFLEDIIIGCTTSGTIVCNVYKYCQQAVTLDGVTRNYGDVFYVHDTTNKIVDFYILCGQYATSQFTPATKIGNTSISGITQLSGTATYYSSGDKVWASGNSTTYATLDKIPDISNTLSYDPIEEYDNTTPQINATYDSSGNKIDEVYLKKTDASSTYLTPAAASSTYLQNSVITYSTSLAITTSWINTGIQGSNLLETGLYAYRVNFNCSGTAGLWSESLGGTLQWYSGSTNSGNAHNCPGNMAGHAPNNNTVQLRVCRTGSGILYLQIYGSVANSTAIPCTFTFRKLL